MKKDFRFREIPYNYTSFSDKEIILKYFDKDTWDILNRLRDKRITGRSAKLLLEIYGDFFIIDRNPYIFNNLLENNKKRLKLEKIHNMRLDIIEKGINPDDNTSSLVKALLTKTKKFKTAFFRQFEYEKKMRKKLLPVLASITNKTNISFSAFDKVSHSTDASDWRIEYPFVIVYPDSESEIAKLIKAAKKLDLKIIPRGAGTGLTGGAVPVFKNTMIINTEKLNKIVGITKLSENNKDINIIELGSGVVTNDAMNYSKKRGLIFATDPTSAWASTIGGNIAENSGGKKAVMWGTAIDNIYSFKIFNSNGNILEVKRRDHPHRKIMTNDNVIFDVYLCDKAKGIYRARKKKNKLINSIIMMGKDIRKNGLGKDVTNKALMGVPGIQKEGGDGIITSAKFVLYEPFSFKRTICLEFFGKNMLNASKAIIYIIELFKNNDNAFLTALEHFDNKYIDAINYKNKSDRIDKIKAVLLIDIEGNNEDYVISACDNIISSLISYNAQGFTASTERDRESFWADRKNLGAIAKHTNAFKLNEDIVIPLDSLPEFADFIEKLNIQKELANNIKAIDKINNYLNSISDKHNEFTSNRIINYINYIRDISKTFSDYIADLDSLGDNGLSLFELIRDGKVLISVRELVIDYFRKSFQGHDDILNGLIKVLEEVIAKRLVIATHMHAGDGNIHVNIPVHSSDYMMMQDADDTVTIIMKKATDLNGVISGEHGIGLTKLRFLDSHNINEYNKYKKESDPHDLFNPGKLISDFPINTIYTPSFNLLELEAFILKATDLELLNMSIANCLRCCKCKTVCNTNYPAKTMFYNPRNKILGVALISEAVLYDAQTSNHLSFRHFKMLRDISDHCTLCHKCEVPCPVNIDFGNITLSIRKLLIDRKKRRFHLITWLTLFYLSRHNYYINKILRLGFLSLGFKAQRMAHYITKPFYKVLDKAIPTIAGFLKGRFPKTSGLSIRDRLNLKGVNTFFAFHNQSMPIKKSVLYFAGCGSERMFPDISIAVIALLYYSGIQVVISPEYLCCGYPALANGKTNMAETISYENRVIFHRMADLIGYMKIKDIILSCGTCHERISDHNLYNIFEGSKLRDISEFIAIERLYKKNLNCDYIYHTPCHTPVKDMAINKVFDDILESKVNLTETCCGEAGTLALSSPHISNALRDRKEKDIINSFSLKNNKKANIITSCPSCVQGLSKISNGLSVKGEHLAVHLAKEFLGKRWKAKFLREVQKDGIEHIFM